MQIVRELGGYSPGRADLVRRAMSKKKADVMAEEKTAFVNGAVERGIDQNTAVSVFDEMMDFASYAFNKSHAAAYAVVAYQTAWLKYYYPSEFFSALLNSFIDSSGRITKYIMIAKKEGINIIPPDINKSGSAFTAIGTEIVFGLGAIKNVGEGVVEEIEAERIKHGAFVSFTDFCQRMSGKKVNKRVVENLIKSGAFDSMGLKRSVLLYEYEALMDKIAATAKNEMPGQISLFDMADEIEFKSNTDSFPDRNELPKANILAMEKESIGMYVSGHPLDVYRDMQFSAGITTVLSVLEDENGEFAPDTYVEMIGIISGVRVRRTKRNEIMKYINLEDLTGTIECLVFPNGVRAYDSLLEKDKIVLIKGELDIGDDQPPKVRVRSVEPLRSEKLYIRLKTNNENDLKAIKRVLNGAKGSAGIYVYFEDTKKTLKAQSSIDLNDNRIETLKEIFGENNIKTVIK